MKVTTYFVNQEKFVGAERVPRDGTCMSEMSTVQNIFETSQISPLTQQLFIFLKFKPSKSILTRRLVPVPEKFLSRKVESALKFLIPRKNTSDKLGPTSNNVSGFGVFGK